MKTLAYALRSEFDGTVDVQPDVDSDATEERPKFGGGVLAVGDGDFDVAGALDEGGGVITIYAHDQLLRDLLDAYPPLKRVGDAGGAPVSPYARQTEDALRHTASLRDIEHAGSASRTQLEDALLADDARIHGEVSGDVDPGDLVVDATADPDEDDDVVPTEIDETATGEGDDD